MGWQDRNYNSGREQIYSYFSSPQSLLQFSVPIYKSRGLYIRLHFWFLIVALFTVIGLIQQHQFGYIPLFLGLMLVANLLHELGHRIFARWVGGDHWEWVIWALGGMIPPAAPRTPWCVFVANIGGVVASVLLAGMSFAALSFIPGSHVALVYSLDPMQFMSALAGYDGNIAWMRVVVDGLAFFFTMNVAIAGINLFPAYWFDGGYIWQSILWPKLGLWKATMVTCMAGMVLAAPLFFLSMWGRSLFGMILWALIFSDCFNRRRMLKEAGPAVMDEDTGPSYNYMDTADAGRKTKKKPKSLAKNARKRADVERAEQEKIDAILAKVKEKGLHSLSWFEKRTLKKATERQRKRDVARRG